MFTQLVCQATTKIHSLDKLLQLLDGEPWRKGLVQSVQFRITGKWKYLKTRNAETDINLLTLLEPKLVRIWCAQVLKMVRVSLTETAEVRQKTVFDCKWRKIFTYMFYIYVFLLRPFNSGPQTGLRPIGDTSYTIIHNSLTNFVSRPGNSNEKWIFYSCRRGLFHLFQLS